MKFDDTKGFWLEVVFPMSELESFEQHIDRVNGVGVVKQKDVIIRSVITVKMTIGFIDIDKGLCQCLVFVNPLFLAIGFFQLLRLKWFFSFLAKKGFHKHIKGVKTRLVKDRVASLHILKQLRGELLNGCC